MSETELTTTEEFEQDNAQIDEEIIDEVVE